MRGRLISAVGSMLLLLTACGSDQGASTTGPEAPSDQTTSAQPDPTSGSEPEDPGTGSGDRGTLTRGGQEWPIFGVAQVVVGEYTYEISLLECQVDDDDRLYGSGYGGDEATGQFMQFFIQPEGSSEPGGALVHAITVYDAGENLNWNAGSGPFLGPITSEHSTILDWARDGMKALGSALFIEENFAYGQDENADYPEPSPVEGTFEIDCS